MSDSWIPRNLRSWTHGLSESVEPLDSQPAHLPEEEIKARGKVRDGVKCCPSSPGWFEEEVDARLPAGSKKSDKAKGSGMLGFSSQVCHK